MAYSAALCWLCCGLLLSVPATAAQSSPAQPRALALPVTYKPRQHGIAKRQEDVDIPLYNISTVSYLVELLIGTPGQAVRVAIDTGSSELWVNPECRTAQTPSSVQECQADGQFEPDDSSTFEDLNTRNQIPYGIGSVSIDYGKDNIALADSSINLTNVQFGLATSSKDLSEGILGLSFGNHGETADLKYANIVDELAEQNITSSRAFSVALGTQDENNGGTVVFGGIDTSKYAGPLYPFEILGPQYGEKLYRYWVQMDSVGSTASGSSRAYENSSGPIVLDTGSSLCTFNQDVVEGMIRDIGGRVDSQGNILVDCSAGNTDATFDFVFGNLTIHVPYSEFIFPATSTQCILGAMVATGDQPITLLGDTFLRSVYTVYDQTNMEISMAPFANCGESVQEFGPGPVGGVQGACDMSAVPGNGNSGGGRAAVGSWSLLAGASLACVAFGLM